MKPHMHLLRFRLSQSHEGVIHFNVSIRKTNINQVLNEAKNRISSRSTNPLPFLGGVHYGNHFFNLYVHLIQPYDHHNRNEVIIWVYKLSLLHHFCDKPSCSTYKSPPFSFSDTFEGTSNRIYRWCWISWTMQYLYSRCFDCTVTHIY